MTLSEIPNELLRMILSRLFDLDVCSFHVARRTCKAFDESATDILVRDVMKHGLALHDYLMSYFGAIIDTSTVPSFQGQEVVRDSMVPFRALPWVANAQRRTKFLHPRATWRSLPLAYAAGTIVNELQAVQVEMDDFGGLHNFEGSAVLFPLWHLDGGSDPSSYSYEDLRTPQNGVTIGWLYDVILSHMSVYPDPLGKGWKVLFESRVPDPAQFWDAVRCFRSREKEFSREDIDAMVGKSERCAVLFEIGGGYSKTEGDTAEEAWIPEIAGDGMPITTPF